MTILSILVVDDDPALLRLLQKQLTKAEYRVEIAEDGYVAKDLLEKHRYDVVLTDLIMPGEIGGIEILDIAKKKDRSIEVLLITGHSSLDTAVEAMKKGANDYLEKPINFEELFLRLDKIAHAKTMRKSATDLSLALNRTESEATQTIQMLEILSNNLQQSMQEIENALRAANRSPESNIAHALSIISQHAGRSTTQ